jgi:Kef-type K+ transport system membrane component KefB
LESYAFLFNLAIILLSTKVLGLFSRQLKMPQVVGALLAGLLLGPAGFNILQQTEFLSKLSELGVIVIMFTAGLQTDVVELRKAGKASLVIALVGVLIPMAGGTAVAYIFNRGGLTLQNTSVLLQNIFIGVNLTSTSVSITVETLRELGKLDTRAGSAILGAALIDDVLGILALTMVTSMADPAVNVVDVVVLIALFFVLLGFVALLFSRFFNALIQRFQKDMRRFAILAFVFCLLLAYGAQRFFGVADITGAYFAGLIISNTQRTKYIAARFETLSFLLLSPIFFASIGLEAQLPGMSGTIVLFTAALLLVAVLGKVVGCSLSARALGYSSGDSMQIGVGMIARGEVALIIANRGHALGLLNSVFYGPILVMVICTTVVTPILLKVVISKSASGDKYADLVESPLVDRYQETEQLDLAQQTLLDMHHEYYKPAQKEAGAPKKQKPGPQKPENGG